MELFNTQKIVWNMKHFSRSLRSEVRASANLPKKVTDPSGVTIPNYGLSSLHMQIMHRTRTDLEIAEDPLEDLVVLSEVAVEEDGDAVGEVDERGEGPDAVALLDAFGTMYI